MWEAWQGVGVNWWVMNYYAHVSRDPKGNGDNSKQQQLALEPQHSLVTMWMGWDGGSNHGQSFPDSEPPHCRKL